MNCVASAGAPMIGTIGSWMSIVGFGTTICMSLPASFAAYASLSYVRRTSPWPARNAAIERDADDGCETTCWNTDLTYFVAWASVLPFVRCAP